MILICQLNLKQFKKHTLKITIFVCFVWLKSWWFEIALEIYFRFICDGVRIFCDGSIIFFSRVASLFLHNAFLVILNAVVGLGLFLYPQI